MQHISTQVFETIKQKWNDVRTGYNKKTVFIAVKELFPDLKKKDFDTVLKSFSNSTLTAKHKKNTNHSKTSFEIPYSSFHMDLVDFRKTDFPNYNAGMNYLLNVVDVGSRYAWVAPLKDKSGPTVAKALKSIMDTFLDRPKYTFISDAGLEFRNQHVQKVLDQNRGILIISKSIHKAMIAERFNRTLKELTQKYMIEAGTKKFIDKLPNLVYNYNHRTHSYHQMTPTYAADPDHYIELFKYMDDIDVASQVTLLQPYNFKVNDIVRLRRIPKIFNKNFQETMWTQMVFRVQTVSTETSNSDAGGVVPVYSLKTFAVGAPIIGRYYNSDLQVVIQPELHFKQLNHDNGRYFLSMDTINVHGQTVTEKAWFEKNQRGNLVLSQNQAHIIPPRRRRVV